MLNIIDTNTNTIKRTLRRTSKIELASGQEVHNPKHDTRHGDFLILEDGTEIVTGTGAVRTITGRTFANDEVTVHVTLSEVPVPMATVETIKAEASARILAVMPEWQQRNMTARAVELSQAGPASWTVAEQTENDALNAAWTWAKNVRLASNVIEADVASLSMEAMRADPRWPTKV